MSAKEAQDYVDLVIEMLRDLDIISEVAYGRMSVNQRDQIAEAIVARSEE